MNPKLSDVLAEAWSARAGLAHRLDANTARLVRNVGEWTAGMMRIACPEEREYIEESLAGFVRDDDPEVTKLVLGLVAQEIQMRQDMRRRRGRASGGLRRGGPGGASGG